MPRSGAVYLNPPWQTRQYPWSPKEDAILSRAFIDLDLDGQDLHVWCKKHGVDRTPGAIDRRLQDLNFFDRRADKWREPKKDKSEAYELAKKNLANQIRLAKIEAATAPLYRGRQEDV